MVNLPKNRLYVIKRDGRKEDIYFDKITSRIQKLCYSLNMDFVVPLSITLKVIDGLYPGVTTVELDALAAEIAASMATSHPDYATLAARIEVSNLHKQTKKNFSEVIQILYNNVNEETQKQHPLICNEYYQIIMENAERLNSCIIYDRDFSFDYFGFKILEESYLLKVNGKIIERPQHMMMRVAVGIHGRDIDAAIETYNYMSERYFTHASATLFYAATPRSQLSSCFSVMMPEDSIDGIFKCVTRCCTLTQTFGAIGVNIHNIRATGTDIAGTNGVSNGLVPMLKVFNEVRNFTDQGGNKRPGAFCIYLEPWHADVFEYLNLKKHTGAELIRARDLEYALWIPDLFMKRVKADGDWSLMCPHQCPGLSDCWGEEFEKLYEKYESEKRFVTQVPAQKLWEAIVTSHVETGTPYMLYKDACNRKSNQQNLGTIKGSSFRADLLQYTSKYETAVGNFASIALNMFVKSDRKTFDFEALKNVTKIVTRNLNKIIDINYYASPECEASSTKHRPISIGIQGLADAFILLRMPYDSDEARRLNLQIFETIYYGALEASCELAESDGPYSTYEGSPISKGILQYDMWNVTPTNLWDWSQLKQKIATHGVRNSLLIALPPMETTAQILSNNKSFEPYKSNIYTRRVSTGEFQIVNQHLLRDLTERGLWDDDIKNHILANNGSIQTISEIPDDLKKIYKTIWEISNRVIINLAVDRGAFVDQSQSLNLYVVKSTYPVLCSIYFYAWEQGLKTGMYHLYPSPSGNFIKFTIDKSKLLVKNTNGTTNTNGSSENGYITNGDDSKEESAFVCTREANCEACSG